LTRWARRRGLQYHFGSFVRDLHGLLEQALELVDGLPEQLPSEGAEESSPLPPPTHDAPSLVLQLVSDLVTAPHAPSRGRGTMVAA
jgi:hypothetical protein